MTNRLSSQDEVRKEQLAMELSLDDWAGMCFDKRSEFLEGNVNAQYLYETYAQETIGREPIRQVLWNQVLELYVDLTEQNDGNLNVAASVHEVLSSIFADAVKSGLIEENPAEHAWEAFKKDMVEEGMGYALTLKQTNSFMNFIWKKEQYRHWFPLFLVMFGTDCQLKEVLGLRWDDFDLVNHKIYVRRTVVLQHGAEGKGEYHVVPVVERCIPMIKGIAMIITDERYGLKKKVGKKLDGMSGFVFRNKAGNFYNSTVINRALKRICRDHNEYEAVYSKEKSPLTLPYFTCRHMRNTYTKYVDCQRER